MKAILKYLPIIFIGVASCKKVENKVIFEGGTVPQLTATTSAVRLEAGEEANLAIRFNWTNPDYKFNTGVSSQNVVYKLEIDTVGSNFTNSKRYVATISSDLSKSFTVGELNGIFGNTIQLQLDPRRNYNLEARITASIGGSVPLVSNKVTFTARPFPPPPKVPFPDAGTLWITGDAVASSWQNPLPSPFDVSQKFTRLNSTNYELTLNMPGGGNYKLIQAQGNWGTQYHMLAGGTWQGGEFEKRDADPAFPGPPTSGSYKISVDFQLGTFKVVKQ
jgi:starch-binding outer membrane protein SusE/F